MKLLDTVQYKKFFRSRTGKVVTIGGAILASYGTYQIWQSFKSSKKGVVWDIGASNTFNHLEKHLSNLKELDIKHVIVKVHDIDHSASARFNFGSFPLEKLQAFQKLLAKNKIGMSIVIWPVPNPQWIQSMENKLIPVLSTLDLETVELEAEGNWSAGAVSGYSDLNEAALALTLPFKGTGVKIGMVTHSGRIGSTALSFHNLINFVVPMAYSTANKGKLPGETQTKMHKKSLKYGVPIHMGLPAWDQEGFENLSGEEAMELAALTSLSFRNVSELRWWSWKWIGGTNGTPRNQYAFDAIKSLKA